MKKLFTTLLAIITLFTFPDASFAINKAVTVSATVGAVSIASQIQILSPSVLDAPGIKKYIKVGTSFTVNFRIIDLDSATVNYAITPSAGAVSLTSGGPVSANPFFDQQFTYLAPLAIPGSGSNQTVTIAVNDGSSVAYKIISLYVY